MTAYDLLLQRAPASGNHRKPPSRLGARLPLGARRSDARVQPSQQSGPPLPLTTVADVPLPGNATRRDYASLDAQRHYLFLAHLGDGAVVVFDTAQRKVITTIPDVSHVHGVLYVPQLDRVYASATGTNEVVAIDTRTLKIVARTPEVIIGA